MTDYDFSDQMTIFDLLDEGQEKDFRTMNIEEIADYIGRKIGAKFVYGHDITEYAATKDKVYMTLNISHYTTLDERKGQPFISVGFQRLNDPSCYGGGAPCDSLEEAVNYFKFHLKKGTGK